MQVKRRSNEARSRETQQVLLDAARSVFIERGYADSSTPAIVKHAGTTRGALYHHYPDKKAIFRAVLEREAERVAEEIEASEVVAGAQDPLHILLLGAESYLHAMQAEGRTRLLLIDGPAVLSASELAEIEGPHARRSLRRGLEELMTESPMEEDVLDCLCELLSAMFDKAALSVVDGASPEKCSTAIHRLLVGLASPVRRACSAGEAF